MHNQVRLFSKDQNELLPFHSGVSLHGHSRHSQESLGFIGKFLQSRRTLKTWIDRQKAYLLSNTGITLDFDRAYWTPPLCEQMAYELEARQIAALGLRPFVSLTDHNSIDACTLLRQSPKFADAPISTEWTVPFGRAVFHIGVHNLPAPAAESYMAAMHQVTAAADERQIFSLFAEFCSIPDVLLVFNHPLWNFDSIPGDVFEFELGRFLASANPYMHGFELNGMRGHEENRGVIGLARAWDQVLISGGDRHACEPNAFLNLSAAADFPEFVDEIRKGRQSTVLVMPQYGQPFGWRLYQNFTHIIADYPNHPANRRSWDQRTFHPDRAGTAVVPMAQLGPPPEFLRRIFTLVLASAHLPIGSLLCRWMVADNASLVVPQDVPAPYAASEPAFRAARSDGQPQTRLDDYLLSRTEPAAD
ncbi:MAG: hypothetical protein WA399_10030 [Acidobacteriaceae bacterium]